MFAIACRVEAFWELVDAETTLKDTQFLRLKKKEDLSVGNLEKFGINTIFFPHWSWKVTKEITDSYECICFHSAPVPFGRGGSPVQNMISRGFDETQVVALKMVDELDAGPVYLRKNVSLKGGGEEIFLRIYKTIIRLIDQFILSKPQPEEQSGKVVTFNQRRPEESRLDSRDTIEALYDHIRMLDVDGYPKAFLEFGPYRIAFSRPALRFGDKIDASVTISKIEKD